MIVFYEIVVYYVSLVLDVNALTFFLLKPNGISEQQIQGLFDKFLKEEVRIEEAENRKEIIEQRGVIF